jgi:hypothetical protein
MIRKKDLKPGQCYKRGSSIYMVTGQYTDRGIDTIGIVRADGLKDGQ